MTVINCDYDDQDCWQRVSEQLDAAKRAAGLRYAGGAWLAPSVYQYQKSRGWLEDGDELRSQYAKAFGYAHDTALLDRPTSQQMPTMVVTKGLGSRYVPPSSSYDDDDDDTESLVLSDAPDDDEDSQGGWEDDVDENDIYDVWHHKAVKEALGDHIYQELLTKHPRTATVRRDGLLVFSPLPVCKALGFSEAIPIGILKRIRKLNDKLKDVLGSEDAEPLFQDEAQAKDAEALDEAIDEAYDKMLAAFNRLIESERHKNANKQQVYDTIRRLAIDNHNHTYIADVAMRLSMQPEQIIPLIQELRREGKLRGAALEGRYSISPNVQRYVTPDNVGIVQIPE